MPDTGLVAVYAGFFLLFLLVLLIFVPGKD